MNRKLKRSKKLVVVDIAKRCGALGVPAGHPVRSLENIRRVARQKVAPSFLSWGHVQAGQGESQTQWPPIRMLVGYWAKGSEPSLSPGGLVGRWVITSWIEGGPALGLWSPQVWIDRPIFFFFFQKFAGTGFEPMTSRL